MTEATKHQLTEFELEMNSQIQGLTEQLKDATLRETLLRQQLAKAATINAAQKQLNENLSAAILASETETEDSKAAKKAKTPQPPRKSKPKPESAQK